MFQETVFGPWYPPIEGHGPEGQAATKLVERSSRSVKLKHASLRRSDKTTSFRESIEEDLDDPGVPIIDDISLSIVDFDQFRRSYWARECFSKMDIASEEEIEVLQSAAIEKLLAREVVNREINDRLRRFQLSGRGLSPETAEVVGVARGIVKRVLGKFSWDRCVRFCRWGPGASTEFGRSRSTPQNKWAVAAHITQECLPLLETYSHWSRWEFSATIVDHNCITTVPKKTTARRTIAMEPTWNMFFQLGVEGAIRSRLNQIGLLVDRPWQSAKARHMLLAKSGSGTPGLFPTLDFKDASNSITKGLCGLLLPTDWLVPLCDTRVNKSLLPDGTTHTLEMFSTMGNGYTFVLMTLLIYAVSTAIVGSPTSVFGDDLVLPDARRYDSVVRVFEELGFCLNRDKSFSQAPFRESCGGHYFKGRDVTPPYFKRKLDLLPAFISYANAITRRAPGQFTDQWRMLMNDIPRKFRGPEGFGDSVAVAPWDMTTPRWCRKTQTWYGTTLVGYFPHRDGAAVGRLRNDLYPFRVGEGSEVFRQESLLYRTGEWSSSRW